MSKLESTKRYIFIINKLKRAKQATFEEIAEYLTKESESDGYYDFTISKRTFQRDLDEIDAIYGIEIKYDFSGKFYFIENDFNPDVNDRMVESIEVYNALKITEHLSPYLHLEKRCAQGTEHLYRLLKALQTQKQIEFSYHKYYDEDPHSHTVEPLALKESRNRWYLFAKNIDDDQVKCYALDRLSNAKILDFSFEPNPDFDITECLKYSFGIIVPCDDHPCEVILSLDPLQGKYIKSLPLHESQQIIEDTAQELRISLNIYITHDFKMELLSLGNTVKVISPTRLIKEMTATHQEALMRYKSLSSKK
jgi:predicted DNA-binding transcriptional regulator YafY